MPVVSSPSTLDMVVVVAGALAEVVGGDARASSIDVHRVRGDLWVDVLTDDPARFIGPRRATATKLRALLAQRLGVPRVRLNIHLEPRFDRPPGHLNEYLWNNGLLRRIGRLDTRETPPTLFHRDDYVGYGTRPLPDESDDEVAGLLAMVTSPEGYRALDAELSDLDRDVLMAYAERMSVLAVRRGDAGLLTDALVALSLGGLAVGDRDAMTVSVLPYRAAELLGVEPHRPYEEAAGRVGEPARRGLADFLARDDKRISVMGYEESTDDDGFTFENTW